jgi:hypothetical protein
MPTRDELTDKAKREYKQRGRLIRQLGLGQTYAEYLASPRWQGIRARVMQRDAGLCQVCGKAATQVHHQRYRRDNLLGLSLAHLIAICGDCHRIVEFSEQKRKRAPSEAEKATVKLARECGGGLSATPGKRPTKAQRKARRVQRAITQAERQQRAKIERDNQQRLESMERREKQAFRPTITPPLTTGPNIPPTAWRPR